MKQVKLVDNTETGHHKVYQETLDKLDICNAKNYKIEFCSIKKNPFKAYSSRNRFLKNTLDNTEIIHFLYIDSLYKSLFIANKLKHEKLIGTLHWIPTNLLNWILLKKFCGNLKYVIVHSEYLAAEMIKNGINNVKIFEYPSFVNKNQKFTLKKQSKNKIVISCLGGTRYDKGLDILIESFKYIDQKSKKNLIFNIAGIEQDIKYCDVIQKAKENNINVRINNNFLSDEEYEKEINESDVILLPYRKIFSGNSGPMTDGIFMNKFILGPNEGNLGFLINEYNLGDIFECENPIDLAKKISDLVNIDLKKEHKYREELKVERFIEKHKILYDKVAKEL